MEVMSLLIRETHSLTTTLPSNGNSARTLRCLLAGRKGSAGWVGGSGDHETVGLTALRFTCAARARMPKPERRTACTHVSRAMQAARRRSGFDFASRLGRRAEAGPRRVLPRVRPLGTSRPIGLRVHHGRCVCASAARRYSTSQRSSPGFDETIKSAYSPRI